MARLTLSALIVATTHARAWALGLAALALSVALPAAAQDKPYDLSQLTPAVRQAASLARAAETRALDAATQARAAAARAEDAARRARAAAPGHRVYEADEFHYEVAFANGAPHGEGVSVDLSARYRDDRYAGQWAAGEQQGYGVLVLGANENNALGALRYEGGWMQSSFEGDGVYFWRNGDRDAGMFKAGLAEGHGVRRYANGERYEGFWRNDQQDGDGVLWDAQGHVISAGAFAHGSYVGVGGDEPVARNGAVPATFVASAARELLAGDSTAISSFVTWSDTPQGHKFWSDERDRLQSGKPLSAEARAAIAGWLANARD